MARSSTPLRDRLGPMQRPVPVPAGLESLEEIDAAMQRPDMATRRAWLTRHCGMLTRLLDTPNVQNVDRRIYRARYWQDDRLIVATIIQLPKAQPGTTKLMLRAMRGYDAWPGQCPAMDLPDKCAIDDLVAFFRLDIVDPDSIDWTDETGYIALLTNVSDALTRMVD